MRLKRLHFHECGDVAAKGKQFALKSFDGRLHGVIPVADRVMTGCQRQVDGTTRKKTGVREMENFERAIHNEVIAQGGTELAKSMGVNRTRLLDCANPNREEHRMNLQMFGQVLAHLSEDGRRRVLSSLVEEFGYGLIDRVAPQATALQAAVLHMHDEIADVTKSVIDALADGHVSQIEKQQIKRAIGEASASLEVLRESVKAA